MKWSMRVLEVFSSGEGGGGNCKDIWTGASRKESDLFLHTGSGAPQHISFN